MNLLALQGCRPEPLGSYLKALGVLRVVAAEKDPQVKGHWEEDVFVLSTMLDRAALLDFFLEEYRPTPIVAPWNRGSGFGPKDQQAGIAAIETSAAPRLVAYREAICAGRAIRERADASGWTKDQVVEACRGTLPDDTVAWIDAAVVLTADGMAFPPLLGTGGNSGRLEFSNCFMQRLVDALPELRGGSVSAREESRTWLAAALSAEGPRIGVRGPVGQFDPGGAGGVNSSPTGAADSLVNPWDFVLLIEGALIFAGAPARRLGVGAKGKATMPFMVDASPAGYASAGADEAARGEVWCPLWGRPAAASEVVHLIGEGRSEWRGRQARRAVDMARAVASLGVDRGIAGFVRYAFVERFGQSTLAVPAGRIDATPRAEVPPLAQLDLWLEAVRRGQEPPAAVAAAILCIDEALFALSARGGAIRLQAVLTAAAATDSAVGRATGFRSRAGVGPLSGLLADDWLAHLDDGTPELRIAAALASQRDEEADSALRLMLRPVVRGQRGLDWSDGPPRVEGFGLRPIVDVLAAAHIRRALDAAAGREANGGGDAVGVQTAFRWRLPAPAADVAAFILGELDDGRIADLLAGLVLLDWGVDHDLTGPFHVDGPRGPVDSAWSILAPFFHGRPIRVHDRGPVSLLPEKTWPAQLSRGHIHPVIESALRRLRIARLDPAPSDPSAIAAAAPPGSLLAAALLCPLGTKDVERLLAVAVPPSVD